MIPQETIDEMRTRATGFNNQKEVARIKKIERMQEFNS